MQVAEISRRRHGKYEDPSESRRQRTLIYTIPNEEGEHVQVCRNIFRNVFGVSARHLQTLKNFKKQGKFQYEDRLVKASR
ncbi:hypothetical protein HNY73_008966 [Argiope bruennichi]|uniref:Uncharacterized protein n=1 Tax=Argiope bruennichi TaxID=94029 RepID=A0A8T0F834_ARGBR|nr:hypothetical protein HNY73_008966 [Argiope bruennichi]